ncbi:hypothetical protein ACFWV1_26355 [Streptomyces sp. NPDC058700]|uniref:hypothetical protein n=1 Tax=Streptomyces sp. NPDC058700 TaxID=3346607 RepID=UPI003655A549
MDVFDGPFPPPLAAGVDAEDVRGEGFVACFICRAAAASAAARAFFTSSRLMFAPPFFFHRSAPARSHARITLGGFFEEFVPLVLVEFEVLSAESSGAVSWKTALDMPAEPAAAPAVLASPSLPPVTDATGRAGATGVSSELSSPPEAAAEMAAGLPSGPGTAAGAVSSAIKSSLS